MSPETIAKRHEHDKGWTGEHPDVTFVGGVPFKQCHEDRGALLTYVAELNSALTVRNADVKAMFERAQAVEAFVEDMHAVGRLRLTPEWQERMDRVMRFRKREMQPTD